MAQVAPPSVVCIICEPAARTPVRALPKQTRLADIAGAVVRLLHWERTLEAHLGGTPFKPRRDLNAKKTDCGAVITHGDVRFDTYQAQLKSVGLRSVEKLGVYRKQYLQRRALVEGFSASAGSEVARQDLSTRRADAVRAAPMNQGVSRDRIATQGYGEAYTVVGR